MSSNFFKQKTAYEMSASLVGSEMCIRDRYTTITAIIIALESRAELELTSLVRTHTDVSGFLYFKHEQSDNCLLYTSPSPRD
ncbi:hypothetical protein JMUB7542_27840 [Staphylococcus aureus]